jgi:hypothetical protein
MTVYSQHQQQQQHAAAAYQHAMALMSLQQQYVPVTCEYNSYMTAPNALTSFAPITPQSSSLTSSASSISSLTSIANSQPTTSSSSSSSSSSSVPTSSVDGQQLVGSQQFSQAMFSASHLLGAPLTAGGYYAPKPAPVAPAPNALAFMAHFQQLMAAGRIPAQFAMPQLQIPTSGGLYYAPQAGLMSPPVAQPNPNQGAISAAIAAAAAAAAAANNSSSQPPAKKMKRDHD